MPLEINQFSVVEITPTGLSGNWYRVGRRTRRRDGTVIAGYSLPPTGQRVGRFDVTNCAVGYFAALARSLRRRRRQSGTDINAIRRDAGARGSGPCSER